jgi:phosphate-selective porin OprO and OprP
MNSLRLCVVPLALALGFAVTTASAQAQSEKPANGATQSTSAVASKAEVDELRQEVASQRRAIEQLQALIERMIDAKAPASTLPTDGAHLINATLNLSTPMAEATPPAAPAAAAAVSSEVAEAALPAEPLESQEKKNDAPPVTSGFNGEHFFIKSANGQFQIMPYGYVQTSYSSYIGDGSPADSFSVRRARFGFQGNYGDHYQFGILIDAAPASVAGVQQAVLRDLYLNWKFTNQFQIQVGQFKEPFSQEELAGVTNLDFVERGVETRLYPSAVSAFRSPGVTIHGDIHHGAFQYWAGAFNGKGYSTNNTTSVPETVGRVRFYPWRNHKDSVLNKLAFGGSMAFSKTRGESGEMTPTMTMNDGAYTWFPAFPVNGNVWRYQGEFTYIKGPMAFRDEYVLASFNRTGVGTEQLGGLGFANLPNIRYQGWDSTFTYILTKELRPENGTPRVTHPVFGPSSDGGNGRGWGAWEIGVRYSGIQGNEPGIFFDNVFTPQLVPTFNYHTDQFTFGVNWYLNYWVKFQSNVNIDRLKDVSTIGVVPQNYAVFVQRLQFRF